MRAKPVYPPAGLASKVGQARYDPKVLRLASRDIMCIIMEGAEHYKVSVRTLQRRVEQGVLAELATEVPLLCLLEAKH